MYIGYIQEIDGLDIITGVDKKGIDLPETKKVMSLKLIESDEMKAIKTINGKIGMYNGNILKIKIEEKKLIYNIALEKKVLVESIRPFLPENEGILDSNGIDIPIVRLKDMTLGQGELFNDYNKSRQFNNIQINILKKNLPALNKNLKLKEKSLIIENAVYQETGKNQIDLTEAQYNLYKRNLIDIRNYHNTTKKWRFLLSNGELLNDNRGRVVWIKNDKWKKRTLQLLTDIKETLEIWENELTDEQKNEIIIQVEAERIIGLTQEEKEAEKNIMIDNALKASVQMRNELEILGDPDALQKSQDWYNAEVVKIEEKYS
jgi:hypothetical protein